MKKVLVFIICLLLVSCANNGDFSVLLNEIFNSDNDNILIRTNNYGQYIDYYLPSDVQQYHGDHLSNTFTYNGSKIIMDVNISAIINSKYYKDVKIADEGFFNDNELIYSIQGTYPKDEKDIQYFYHIYQHYDNYLGYFVSDELIFYTYMVYEDIIPVSSRIFLMAKGVNVKNEQIIANYSSKDVIDYQKKQVNLFETVMPVNGVVEDFMINHNEENDGE